jgi:hypothetical protein
MRDFGEISAVIVVLAFVLVGLVAASAAGVWAWQNAADKRVCRQHGGTVIDLGNAEWHCVGAVPEGR